MAAPTSSVATKRGKIMQWAIPAQTSSFDFPFQQKGCQGISVQLVGTMGTSTNNVQVSCNNSDFTNAALQQTTTISHTELVALTVALSPYSFKREDLGYPYLNLHHVAGGGSSIAFYITIVEI